MRSDVCTIEKGSKDLAAIFAESERVAAYNGLDHKQTLQLRLLCEEIDGMLPNIINDFEGKLWFEFEDGVCKINISIELENMTADKKDELIKISNNKKNAAAVGIVGKIRSAIENFFLDEASLGAFAMSSGTFHLSTGYVEGMDYAYLWSLDKYRNTVKKDEKEAWDELEKSVIASLADDVTVGVKGARADIIVTKKFA